jgi:hypothetical protein
MKDTLTLADTVSDGYGDKSVIVATQVKCLFLQSTGNSHSSNTEVASSDAHVYIDIEDPTLIEKGYRIEGMLVNINPFGADEDECWYKITRVVIGQRKLIDNQVDNVHAFLQKVAKPIQDVVS